ncbi:MAG TPA: RidA family protein [Steroidobacteraceae bacterium]|jgi:enamine deaminase RidA (YjgF/YER057c/UK114 family)|nr:RidA family protein [Steroidobacteraceae bacterium]
MITETLQPEEWPRPKGYANGMAARGRMIFISGQIGWDAQERFTSDTLAGQVKQALRNIVRVLEEGGAEPRHVVRLTWFVLSRDAYLSEAREIGAGYREILGKHFPAMSVVEVRALVEPRALVEIEATAVIPDEETDGRMASDGKRRLVAP